MGQVTVRINGRDYPMSCDDGDEPHVAALGRFVDERMRRLVEQVGQVGEARLLAMLSLVIADELHDACAELETRAPATANGDAAAAALESCAQRLETIASRLEAP